jgi:hypothetical protein
MKEDVARLEKLPLEVGPWKGTLGDKLDDSMRKAAGAEGDQCILYTNELTGEKARMFIDCGRLADMSKHRPDRCYPAQGYTADSEETQLEKVTTAAQSKVEFRTAVYSKADLKTRIYWSWASEGVWKAPDGEDGLRKVFPRTRPVYKLYVDNPVRRADEQASEGPSIELIKVLIPAYEKVLFPPEDKAAHAAAASPRKSAHG